MKKINCYSFFAIFGTVFLLILYKIIFIPITHDETATPIHYINFSIWQIMMFPDIWANNHILNTLIVKMLVYIFGINQVIIRIPNILAFIIYALAVFRINRIALKEDSIWFIPASLLYIAYPYFLDFFGLCRGYGISWALATLSLSYLLSGYLYSRDRNIWISFGLSILASYANFTLLIFWLANTILTWIYFYSNSIGQYKQLIKSSIVIIITVFVYLALIFKPIFTLISANQFIYWPSSGIFSQTALSYIILFIIIIFFSYLQFELNKDRNRRITFNNPVIISFSALMLTAFITIMQCIILKTPSLKGRVALFFFPLLITSFVCLLGMAQVNKRRVTNYFIALIISFSCIFNVAYTYSLKYTIQWNFDENTFDVLNYLESKKQPNSPIILKTDWLFHPSFNFYSYIGKTPWLKLKEYDKNIDINTDAEYYYIFSKNYEILEPRFEPVYKINEDRWLLRRRQSAEKNFIKELNESK